MYSLDRFCSEDVRKFFGVAYYCNRELSSHCFSVVFVFTHHRNTIAPPDEYEMNKGYTIPMRILVVEDNEKLSKYVTQMLEEAGYSVDVAFDGETGERMSGGNEYDLIILDIMLPKKDGLAVCKDLRSDGNNVPVLMLTAMGE